MRINDIAWKSFRDKTKNRGPALSIGIKRVSKGILITFAACSPKDIFSRKIARKIVEGRLSQFTVEQKTSGQARSLFDGTTFFPVGHYLWLIPVNELGEFEYRGKYLLTAKLFLEAFIQEGSLRRIRWLKEMAENGMV